MIANVLLAIIAGGDAEGLFEVRCRDPQSERITAREWFPLDAREACQQFISSHASTLDVWIGAALRSRRGGRKSAVRHGWCLWVDIDTAESLARLRRFQPRPTLVVRSGSPSHIHAWWALCEPVPPAWLERANRRLSKALGSDMKIDENGKPQRNAVENADRIMRVPGTWNHKTSPPLPVTVSRGPTASHVPSLTAWGVVKNLPDAEVKPPSVRAPRPDVYADDPLLGVSAERYYMVLTGRSVPQYGNVTCPFHNGGRERSPSMRLYPEGTFYCFSCGAGGSIIQFAAHLWGYADTRGQNYRDIRERLTDVLG